MGGHSLRLLFIIEKHSWCAPSCVIIKDTLGPDDREKRDVQIIHQASLVGNLFIRDSRKIIDIIKELTLGTDAKTCIKGLKCGRNAMQELQSHYDRTQKDTRKKQVAKADLKKIFYKNETNFTLEKYVTKLKGVFNVLDIYGITLYENQMKEHIIDQIMSPNIELNTEVNICMSSHLSTLLKAYTYMSTVVSKLYPTTNPSSGRFRK